VSDGRLRISVFLNTQADGTSMESPHMLLCRSLKAAGSLVVEDPDDSPVYANRALQLDYLERGGFPVARRLVVRRWEPGRAIFTAGQQAKLGRSWSARPAIGLDWRVHLSGTRKLTPGLLAANGFKPQHGVVLYPNRQFAVDRNGSTRFHLWYFFGHVVVYRYCIDRHSYELLGAGSDGGRILSRMAGLAHGIATITGLDWFVSEAAEAERGGEMDCTVLEPANALAQLGPGRKILANLPDEVVHVAAGQLVEATWRHTRGLPLVDGITLRLGRS
jgi:hypothetical protein